MKKIVFIGNRFPVLNILLRDSDFSVAHILAQKDSYLQKELNAQSIPYISYGTDDKDKIVNIILSADYDILVSNGCTFILPISKFQNKHRLFINIHPSYLPYLRGRHPINGVFINEMKFFGASVHYMDDTIDTGRLIVRRKVKLTSDIDLWLLYKIAFTLEASVFQEALKILKSHNFQYSGFKLKHAGNYYTRKEKDMRVDFCSMSTRDILIRINAFGIQSQGVTALIQEKLYKLFDAVQVINPYIHSIYSNRAAGTLIAGDKDKLLVKTIDSIIRVTSYVEMLSFSNHE